MEVLQAVVASVPRELPVILDVKRGDVGHTARRYAELAEPVLQPVFERVMQEYERSVALVLQVTRQSELLEHSPMLARSIKLRNPYVDALHVAQLALLRRFRALPAAHFHPSASAFSPITIVFSAKKDLSGIRAQSRTLSCLPTKRSAEQIA